MKAASAIVVGALLVVALVGCEAPEPAAPEVATVTGEKKKVYECRWATSKIKIDGVINEIAWEPLNKDPKAGAQAIDFMVSWENRAPKTKTVARLLWDKNYLYFCAEMDDTDLYADVKEPNGKLWENDVFELFFKPPGKKKESVSLAYYEFQVNAANTPLELYFPSRGSGGYRRFAAQTPIHLESAVKLKGTLNDWTDKDKGWVVEGRIPWEAFKATGGMPKAGDRWLFALCRYDYSKDFERPELSSCAPLTQSDFHRYEDYAELLFVGPP